MKNALLVNGVPASGKSFLAHGLASSLGLPILSLDTVKEALFDTLGTGGGDREYKRSLGRASMAAIWSLIADFPENAGVIVEAWFGSQTHESVLAGLERAGVGPTAEVWCHAPREVLGRRYAERIGRRHPGHPGASYLPELVELADRASPMALGPVLWVETTDPGAVDVIAVSRWVAATLGMTLSESESPGEDLRGGVLNPLQE